MFHPMHQASQPPLVQCAAAEPDVVRWLEAQQKEVFAMAIDRCNRMPGGRGPQPPLAYMCISCSHEIDVLSRQPMAGPPLRPSLFKGPFMDPSRSWAWAKCIRCRPSTVSRPRLTCVECGADGYEASQLLLDEDVVLASWIRRAWARCYATLRRLMLKWRCLPKPCV